MAKDRMTMKGGLEKSAIKKSSENSDESSLLWILHGIGSVLRSYLANRLDTQPSFPELVLTRSHSPFLSSTVRFSPPRAEVTTEKLVPGPVRTLSDLGTTFTVSPPPVEEEGASGGLEETGWPCGLP